MRARVRPDATHVLECWTVLSALAAVVPEVAVPPTEYVTASEEPVLPVRVMRNVPLPLSAGLLPCFATVTCALSAS